MALETATYISGLNSSNPVGASDPKSQGDDHMRLIKATLLNTFPNITGAMTASHSELNILDGATLSTAELNILDGVTATAAELNILDGVTASAAELNKLTGVGTLYHTGNVSTLEGDVSHDNLVGFVADEHIAHSGVSITAGDGLTGGGAINATRQLDVGEGDGISVTANAVAVDSTVARNNADEVFSGSLEVGDDFITSGVITNTSTGTLDDVSTTNAAILRFTGGSAVTLTGLAGGATGRRMTILNLTASTMTFNNEDTGSVAANRFGFAANLSIGTMMGADFVYDGTSNRWRRVF